MTDTTWQKSSFPNGQDESVEVRISPWLKSSYSTDGDNNCVELAHAPTRVLLRESEAPDTVLATTPTALAALLRTTKTGMLAVNPAEPR